MGNGIDFCPYQFVPLDRNNMAYELVFADKKIKKWVDLTEYTSLKFANDRDFACLDEFCDIREQIDNEYAIFTKKYLSDSDKQAEKFFKADNSVTRCILKGNGERLKNPSRSGDNGLNSFINLVNHCNDLLDKMLNSGIQSEIPKLADLIDVTCMKGNSKEWDSESGRYTFRDKETGRVVFYAYPCCPRCHMRLPNGFLDVDDFAGFSLMGDTASGKTTMLLSSIQEGGWNNLAQIYQFSNANKAPLMIRSANYKDAGDFTYKEMLQASNALYDEAKCPDHTNRDTKIPPVFLKVSYKDMKLLVGIYDNAGENIRKMGTYDDDSLGLDIEMLLDEKLFADIYFFDPKTFPGFGKKPRKMGYIMSPSEQGIFQASHRSMNLTEITPIIEQRLSERGTPKTRKKLNTVFSNYEIVAGDKLKNRVSACIISKGDLLEEEVELKRFGDGYGLFNRDSDFVDSNYDVIKDKEPAAMEARNEAVRELIKQFKLFGNQLPLSRIDNAYGGTKDVSWFLSSATGTATDHEKDEAGGMLKSSIDPIRTADPWLYCIRKKLLSMENSR